MRCNFPPRSDVSPLSAAKKPHDEREDDHSSQNRATVIHVRCCNWYLGRERQKDGHKDQICQRRNIDGQTKLPKVERPVGDVLSAESFDDLQGDWNGVGDVESQSRKRENCVQSGGGAYVNDGKANHDERNKADRANWDTVVWVDLFIPTRLERCKS